ncbi:MAG: hypothetical protein LAQ69_26790 [Acidobacteriia bacterium]|nr:hypothetical protein [Terriglobia bacterium]
MSNQRTSQDRDLLRQWVDIWRRAGEELDEIRRREIECADTQPAIHQLFGTGDSTDNPRHSILNTPPRTDPGLVEQQAWFARLRSTHLDR